MSEEHRKDRAVIIAFLLFMSLFVSWQLTMLHAHIEEKEQNAPARFVISSWSYPDDYGQGIYLIKIYENSTGSFLHFDDLFYNEPSPVIYDWNHSVGIQLYIYTWFNGTVAEETNTTLAQAYQRHNITVANAFGVAEYSKQNITYFSVSDASSPMLYYVYQHELDWLPSAANQYYIDITYEVYYRD